MLIQLEELRAALNILLDHANALRGGAIEVSEDLYWFVPQERLYDPTAEPTGLTLGSLKEDWSEVLAIGAGAKAPIGYGLVWASTVLRAIGDQTP